MSKRPEPAYQHGGIEIYQGCCLDVLPTLPEQSVHCCVTSPPYYGLRDYGVGGQIGLEETLDDYVAKMVEVFRAVWRVLRDDGTLWLNLGDSYNGSGPSGGSGKQDSNKGSQGVTVKNVSGLKPKDLLGIPWRVALALQADGWYLRSDIIWHKPNPMPESVTDRPTKSHEYLFLLTKQPKYFYDAEAVRENKGQPTRRQKTFRGGCYTNNATFDNSVDYEGHQPYLDDAPSMDGRNLRDVWTVASKSYKGAHFATFPPKLIEPCIKAGCPEGGTVLDPFMGSGTTAEVARANGCRSIGIELSAEYIELAKKRLSQATLF